MRSREQRDDGCGMPANGGRGEPTGRKRDDERLATRVAARLPTRGAARGTGSLRKGSPTSLA